ncbi:Similar to phtf: Protein phtf (Drosophila melanogaster) [Cotesia congregata]|uniref:Similar to phtf: Protein phtf (Drosophila melanogaster) n=1 Tax=Cotesia congregata TaxID=51543 RepID=A0A8J2EE52_COTCN|nr:Similar to phtf: Protein phtf (Drosophila melanogaster) [Cotesia congregata]
MRTAKLKTEFIDVDLVRGSSFPKAKPKHGLITVTWLAVKRLILLPFYKSWWIQQTSSRIFLLFILLYSLQIFNIIIFIAGANFNDSDIVSLTEVLMPVAMMFLLCTVHSQIVSTNSGPTISTGINRSRARRSRHERTRPGKLRPRNLQRGHRIGSDINKTSQETVCCDKSNAKNYSSVSPSVRFAKKVCIDPSTPRREIPSSSKELDKSRVITSTPVQESVLNRSRLAVTVANVNLNVDGVHQDDDGFESLNGNVSSDNDRASLRPQVPKDEEIKPESKDINSSKPVESVKQFESEEEGECEETGTNQLTEVTTSATEWMGVTTNSDECSYSSDLDESQLHSDSNYSYGEFVEHPFSWEFELPPSILLSSSCMTSDRVTCTLWTRREIKKAELSVLDISSAIIARAESMPESLDYFYGGLVLSMILAVIPALRRLSDHFGSDTGNSTGIVVDLALIDFNIYVDFLKEIIDVSFGSTLWERTVVLILSFERLILSCLLFFLLAVAERTFKQRLLYAKLFSHLTSSRRARKSDLPHFRLNKVRNIKTWLSVRSYLKRRGPQRSVDVIVSAVFIVTLLLLSFVSLELIKDLESLHSRYNIEALLWSFTLGIYILRFMTLGTKINKKYRNLSILITEQINLYLQIEQKPHKKDELTVANSVLKLAADLIKVS